MEILKFNIYLNKAGEKFGIKKKYIVVHITVYINK